MASPAYRQEPGDRLIMASATERADVEGLPMWLLKPGHELSRCQAAARMTLIALDIMLLVAAWYDLRRRPVQEIRGHRSLWFGVLFVDYVGPLAYFALGRRWSANVPRVR